MLQNEIAIKIFPKSSPQLESNLIFFQCDGRCGCYGHLKRTVGHWYQAKVGEWLSELSFLTTIMQRRSAATRQR